MGNGRRLDTAPSSGAFGMSGRSSIGGTALFDSKTTSASPMAPGSESPPYHGCCQRWTPNRGASHNGRYTRHLGGRMDVRSTAVSCPLSEHLSTMSAYEDYTAVSADYDRTRIPIGIEIILGCLAASGRPLTSLRLLDAGCGTGSFTAALRRHVGAIDAVDLNPSMLCVAREKVDRTRGCPVALHEAGIDALPFDDASSRRGDGESGPASSSGFVPRWLADAPTRAGRACAGAATRRNGGHQHMFPRPDPARLVVSRPWCHARSK